MRARWKQIAGQSLGLLVIMTLALFLPAGTLAWPAGWTFLVLFNGFFLAMNIWLLRHNPGLLQERTRLSTSDQQSWDKVLFLTLQACVVIWLMVMALDAARFHWSQMPTWLQWVGAVILLGSFYLLFLSFRENAYLSPVVRIQNDRGQRVISGGPYRFVRHPMYAGILIFVAGTALLLGAWSGVLLGSLVVILLARRAVLEERTLRQSLPGYGTYMERVRYHLVPFVW